MADVGADTFVTLWGELDSLRESKQLSRQALAGRAGRVMGRVIPAKTLHDRMANGRRVSWDEFRAVVVALGLNERDWHGRWELANSNRHRKLMIASKDSIAHLPADTGGFAGRDDEVNRLRQLLTVDWGETCVPVACVVGMAGVGKTRLAVHVAHLLRERHNEIQLFVDLRGYGPDQPVEPAAALDMLLRHLGIPPQENPASLDAKAALFRDCLHDRRALLLLDNAVSEEQVRPLLPASPACCVIVTSRRQLAGLDEARLMQLDVMPDEEAAGLLAHLVGADRCAAEKEQAREIALLCGGLPLALVLVGCRLRARPAWRLAHMSERLRAEQNRLAELAARDRAVRAAFEMSYHHLAEPARTIFGLLTCHPGPDFSATSAAALARLDRAVVEGVLEELLDEHLLEQQHEGRYRYHDLLRLFAAERPETEDIGAAQRRVLRWYLDVAAQADRLLVPHRPHLDAGRAGADGFDRFDGFDRHEQALHWCDTERAVLDAAVRMAADLGEHTIAWQLPNVLFGFHRLRHSWQEWLGQLRIGLTAAGALADEQAQAWIRNAMGIAYATLDDHESAHECFIEALRMRRRHGDTLGMGQTLNNLGELYRQTGQFHQAINCYQQDREICRELDDHYGESICLNNLGKVQLAIGLTDEALASQQAALKLCRTHQDQLAKAEILDDLGNVHRRFGRDDLALRHYDRAIEVYRAIECDMAAADTLATTVEMLAAAGRHGEADTRADEVLSIIDGPAARDAGSMPERIRRRLAGVPSPR